MIIYKPIVKNEEEEITFEGDEFFEAEK